MATTGRPSAASSARAAPSECRDYGTTMANIRFKEAWTMARWLEKQGKYTIDQDSDL